jgi:signal transduction histidine kinase
MTSPVPPPDADLQYRWVHIWNVLSYLLVAVGVIVSWLDPGLEWPLRLLGLGLAAVWGAWYWGFIVNYRRWRGRTLAKGLSFVFAIELATVLSFIHPAYLLLLFSFYGLTFSSMPVRWAAGLVALQTVSLIVRFTAFSGGLSVESIPLVVSFTVSAFFSVLLGLWIDSVLRQSRERRQMIAELEATRSELAAAERQAGVLEERQRLAGEIHDTLAQGFTGIVMHLEAAEQALDGHPAEARRHLDQARQTARQSLEEARRFLWALRPELLERKPLPQALEEIARRWSSESGIPAWVATSGDLPALAAPCEATLLRAAQEALVNVRKHAFPPGKTAPATPSVTLTLTGMEDELILDVQDNGRGFDPSAPLEPGGDGGGFGLPEMRRRVEQLGGRLEIESAPGEGTTLAVILPAAGKAGR